MYITFKDIWIDRYVYIYTVYIYICIQYVCAHTPLQNVIMSETSQSQPICHIPSRSPRGQVKEKNHDLGYPLASRPKAPSDFGHCDNVYIYIYICDTTHSYLAA